MGHGANRLRQRRVRGAMRERIASETVRRVVETVNRGDAEGFLAFFGKDGVVDDWGGASSAPPP